MTRERWVDARFTFALTGAGGQVFRPGVHQVNANDPRIKRWASKGFIVMEDNDDEPAAEDAGPDGDAE